MHKIDGAGHVNGGFVGEDVDANRPPTEVTPGWLNAVQRELLAIVVAGGFASDVSDDSQVTKAIKRLFGGNVRTITAAGPTILTADDAGLVIVDATANNVAITMPAVNAVTGAPLKFKFVRLDATTNTVTVTRAGADTFMGGAASFTVTGQGDCRAVEGDAVSAWIFTAAAANTNATGFKTPVRFTTTGNVALAGLGTQAGGDWGGALTAGDRILPKDQATGSDRGIYIAAAGAWTRATDADGVGELTSGALVVVQEGATLADSVWELSTDGPITIGTTSLTFVRKDGATVKQIQSLPDPTWASNAMTLPASTHTLDFRSATLGTGVVSTVSGTAAALVIPAGATLGHSNGVSGTDIEVIMNNGGTLEKAIVNLAGGNDLSETGVISTTAISAGATAANVFYSNTARTNLPYRVVREIVSTQATAGQWATPASLVQGAGGQALAAMSSAGFGQTMQFFTVGTNRIVGATYYNLQGKEITILIVNGSATTSSGYVQGGLVASCAAPSGGNSCMSFPVPPGNSYSVNNTASSWAEKR